MNSRKINNIACIICGLIGLWGIWGFIRTAPEWAPLMVNGLLMLSVGVIGYRRIRTPQKPQMYEYFLAYELDGPQYRAKGRCSLLRTAPILCMNDIEGIEEYLQPRHPQGMLLIRGFHLLSQRDKDNNYTSQPQGLN